MKKLLSLFLSVAMVLSIVSTVSAAKFADVDVNYSWALEAIESLTESGVITGYDDGTFKPGKAITRQEALTLFSKALGANSEANKKILDFAYGIYESELSVCADSYAVKQGAYLIYKGILSVSDVVEYLSPAKRNLEFKRYEAATLIAKALGADEWFEKNKNADTTVSYADVDEIPAKYLKYVFFATDAEIMGAMDDNKFGPNEKVTRAQIAVMIKRIADTKDFAYACGLVTAVDTLNNNIAVKTSEGETLKYVVNNSDVIYIDGSRASLNDLEIGMDVSVTLSKGDIYEVDAISHTEDESFSGAYKGQITDNSGSTVKIADVTKENQPVSNYKLASNAVIFYKGETVESLESVKVGDYVTVDIEGGLVVRLIAEAKEEVVSGLKISNINGTNSNGIILTALNKNNEEVKYLVSNDVTVLKNSVTANITDVVVGDTVALTMEYGIVTIIKATGVSKTLEGTIDEITISNATSYITISKDNTKTKYVLARNCSVSLEGEEASVYDLRLGSYVKLKTESDTVVFISAEAVESALQVTGTVKTVNTAYGLVIIEVQTASGVAEKQLFVKDTTKILDSATGKNVSIKNLVAGNIITAAGVEKLGVYEVNAIMILQ